MKNKIVVFDIDDTLYNEIDYVKSGYRVVADYIEKKYLLNGVYNDLLKLFNISSKNVFNRFFEEKNIKYTNADILSLVNTYRNHVPNIKLSTDVINTLKYLKNNYILAIISDGNYNTQRLKVESLELKKYFDCIILTDMYGKSFWKPSRKAFDILNKKYNIELSNMFYIGDNPNKDFYLSNYGIITIRCYNKKGIYYKDKYLNGIKENYKINSFKNLKKLL